MALLILVLIAEVIVAVGAYYLFRKVIKNKPLIVLAIIASLIGLMGGWIVGYRATGSQVTQAYLTKVNEQTIQSRGTPITSAEEERLKEKLFANPQFEYTLHKAAALHALPIFFVVMIIMIVKSRKHSSGGG